MLTKNNDMNQLIEDAALVLFKQYGVKSVSVDDIAQRSGVSKNAIYDLYETKDRLINAALLNFYGEIRREIREIERQHLHPIISIVEIYAYLIREMSMLHPIFLHSIKKYFPSIAEVYIRMQEKIILKSLMPLYQKAKDREIIREDVNIYLLMDLHKKHFDNIFSGDPRKGKQKDYDAMFRHIIVNNLRGILTKENYHILDGELHLSTA